MVIEQSAGAPRSWSDVASISLSARNKTNTLEIRLETEQGVQNSLTNEEIERLLRRLKIGSTDFTSLQACPERKNVVYITLNSSIDLSKYTENSIESFILKPGVRTTTLKHASKKEVNVQVFGLHPDTKDETVIRYLNAHGKVNPNEAVTYAVYPGAPGTSLLAGKRNGNRIYSMVIKRNMGSVHIIDGERVSIKYSGQRRTCNRCHNDADNCPGKAIAKNCTATRIPLSQYMLAYWQSIGFNPEPVDNNDVDEDESEYSENIKTSDQAPKTYPKVSLDSETNNKYGGVVIKGFSKEVDLEGVLNEIKAAGLPEDFGKEDLQTVERGNSLTIYIHDLRPECCINLIDNLNGQVVDNCTIKVFALVTETPSKNNNNPGSSESQNCVEESPKQVKVSKIASNLAKKTSSSC